MGIVINAIKTFCFWGLLFVLLLMIGFGVSINDLWVEAVSGNVNIRIVSIFLLVAPILFVILQVCEIVKDILEGFTSFFDSVATSLLPMFWPIYMLFRRKNFDSLAYVIIMSLLWWGMLAYGIWAVLTIDGNRILNRIMSFDNQQIWTIVGVFVGICLAFFLLALLLWSINGKRIREMISFWDEQ